MPDAPSDPKDMADMLDAIARRMRNAPGAAATTPATAGPGGITIAAPLADGANPWLGEVDVFSDATHVTVTAQTRNADASHVHVSVAEGRLLIGLGEGAQAVRRDLPLPVAVDESQAYATFRNGVLDVVLPRKGAIVRHG